MKDAGTYIVEFRYVGDEYYVLDTIYENYVVGKYEPTLEVIEKEFYYNGEYIGYTVDDVTTNSDGEITLINNLNKDVGTYDVTIRVSETNNYEAKEIHVTQTIKKGIPTVISWPTASTGFDGYVLRTVEITGGSTNIEGRFIWSNGNKNLEVGTYNYSLSFVPNDPQYETISKDIPVETISIEEALRRIKEERNYLYNTYDNILEDDVYQVEDLDITGDKYPVDITWMSSSTVLMINNLGYVNILDVEGAHRVTLTAIMTYGDAAEYATFEFTLHVGNAQKEVKEAPRQVKEKPIPTLSEIGDIVKENQRRAINYITEVAEAGFVKAMKFLISFYRERSDFEKSFYWLEQVAATGDDDCQLRVGRCYEKGTSFVEQDKEKAFEWYLKSAEQGNEQAMERVNVYYASKLYDFKMQK